MSFGIRMGLCEAARLAVWKNHRRKATREVRALAGDVLTKMEIVQ